MPHPIAVRLQLAQLVQALDEARALLAEDERLAPVLLRACSAAVQVAGYLGEGGKPGTDPGA